MTWRYEERNADGFRALRAAGRPFLLSLWHGHLLGLTWHWRGQGITVMISEHSDGEIIARIVERWGFRTVRGSTSRGAGRALLGMVRELKAGREFAITPDGPRGPAGVPQAGVLLASQRSGVPIVPMRGDFSRAWHLRSWDRFAVPKPFARIVITYGDPWLATGTDEAAVAELASRMGPAIPAGLERRK
jgi:lysophospholipid acyltransferase (LPLAT)-like uncharacterized protein